MDALKEQKRLDAELEAALADLDSLLDPRSAASIAVYRADFSFSSWPGAVSRLGMSFVTDDAQEEAAMELVHMATRQQIELVKFLKAQVLAGRLGEVVDSAKPTSGAEAL
jgi:hypothetical protein